MRRSSLVVVGSVLAFAGGMARAQPELAPQLSTPQQEVVETHAVAWPLMFDVHALIGIEPHGERGTPIAFGAGTEIMWRGRIGGFAELLSSDGTGHIVPMANGVVQPGFADRISIPFGLTSRPFSFWYVNRPAWWARLLCGIGVQLGVTVEHLRTSDDSTTTAGLHAAITADVPLYGGPKQGGIALRLGWRLIATPEAHLDTNTMTPVFEPKTTTQLFVGLAYYP